MVKQMEHLLNERRLSLSALAKRENVSLSTTWRWAMRGVRNVKLETLVVGGRRFTTYESFSRFVAASQSSSPASVPRSTDEASSAHRKADEYLRSQGI